MAVKAGRMGAGLPDNLRAVEGLTDMLQPEEVVAAADTDTEHST
jgi:hypothetical protein